MQQFLEEGLAPSTRKVYQAGLNRYKSFSASFNLAPFPVSIEKVTLFVAFLGSQGLSVSTIESYLSALRHFRILLDPSVNNPSFHSPHMAVLLRGIKRHQAQGPRLIRLPITASLMRRIKSILGQQSHTYFHRLLWAACCTGYFGFLRCSEFLVPDGTLFDPSTHLSLADLSLDTSSECWSISLLIKVSKTDQLRKGTTIILGSTNADLCPVAALLDFLAVRGSSPGPLFQLENGNPLRRKEFASQVQQALSSSGLDGLCFNSHSFRIGAATTASAAGLPETTIKLMGRWQSSAFQAYIRPQPEELAQVSRQLASVVV